MGKDREREEMKIGQCERHGWEVQTKNNMTERMRKYETLQSKSYTESR